MWIKNFYFLNLTIEKVSTTLHQFLDKYYNRRSALSYKKSIVSKILYDFYVINGIYLPYSLLYTFMQRNYDKKEAIKLGILKRTNKTPHDYKIDFFVYRREKDIYGNPVIKEELFEGSQKRFIYWVPKRQI